ncbi:lipid-A-disaccharide synthase N-terminal domain-containing protein [Fulvivirgaceae bacterium BMA12]|uniref:Lipid-A-disaccharide synthase N-terminal domain-containing protein n=1 Tax=Agaribacillus aureus TaxID=3051825 RepID=A0ABT8LHR7_9BACT|nr:lipid-A-disaccharide synthase N-terminal domain-containing protein [Fulvivirgaceae bacterium BMA12]
MSDYLIYGIGFTAQVLFSARLLIQWIRSEKAGRVLSPTIFWQLSLIASFILLCYGILRDDLAIILGQFIAYFIYIRNLQFKNAWKFIPSYFRVISLAFPFIAVFWLLSDFSHNIIYIINKEEIPLNVLIWGSAGQVVFTFRFIYQWLYSEKEAKSVLPIGFWIISLAGSLMIISYAVYRLDPVLLLGQVFGSAIYTRNIFIHFKVKDSAVKYRA